jgi:hypothetical protein
MSHKHNPAQREPKANTQWPAPHHPQPDPSNADSSASSSQGPKRENPQGKPRQPERKH